MSRNPDIVEASDYLSKNSGTMEQTEFHQPGSGSQKPRAGLSVNKFLKIQYQEWVRKIQSYDWTAGRTKHWQVQSAFGTAAALGINPQEAQEYVVGMIEDHGGEVVSRDIERIRNRAYECDDSIDCHAIPTPRPLFDREFAERVADLVSVDDPVGFVRSRSPIPCESLTSVEVLEHLYPEAEKILLFDVYKSHGQCLYQIGTGSGEPVPEGGPDGAWFLIQPVDGEYHPNPREGGKRSRRSEESVTTFRYMLLESDDVEEEQWLRIVLQFPLRIAAIYRSGGKSVHVLVKVNASSKDHYDRIKAGMMSLLVTLGADRQALSAVRLSRLPQAWRGDKRQELLYLNPDPLRGRLVDLSTRTETFTPEDDE